MSDFDRSTEDWRDRLEVERVEAEMDADNLTARRIRVTVTLPNKFQSSELVVEYHLTVSGSYYCESAWTPDRGTEPSLPPYPKVITAAVQVSDATIRNHPDVVEIIDPAPRSDQTDTE